MRKEIKIDLEFYQLAEKTADQIDKSVNNTIERAISWYYLYLRYIGEENQLIEKMTEIGRQEDKAQAKKDAGLLMATITNYFSPNLFAAYKKTLEAIVGTTEPDPKI